MPITLKYWNGRGLMEIPRVLLAIAGKFPGEGYVDERHSAPPAAGLEANLGRLPVCVTDDGTVIGQSAAINYYIASETGLMGNNPAEAAQIISICEHVKEMVTAWRVLCPWGAEPTKENLDTWFDSGATDATGPADGSARATRYLKWYSGRIENTIGNGFAVGNKLSLADVMIHNVYAEVLKEHERGELPGYRCEPFCDLARTEVILSNYPKISASCAAVSSNTHVQKWLSTRGPQGF